jgi:hypothetical protein
VTWALELPVEHTKLARAEGEAAARAIEGTPVSAGFERALLALTVDPEAWADRLGLAERVLFVEAKTPVEADAIVDRADRIDPDGTFAVDVVRCVDEWPDELVERIADGVRDAITEHAEHDPEDPDMRVVVLLDREAILGVEAARVREPQLTIGADDPQPRAARATVNLASVPEGQRLWVPWASTGSLALHAAATGADTLATDPDDKRLDRVGEQLDTLDATGAIAHGSLEHVADAIGAVDGLAAAPPDEAFDNEEAYRHALACIAGALKPGHRAAIALTDRELTDAELEALRLVDTYGPVPLGESERTLVLYERKHHG